MVLLFGLPLAFVIGLIVGSRPLQRWCIAAAWFVFLALQTAYLAKPGTTGFGGADGNKAVRGPVYWLIQPALLAACLGVARVGAMLHSRIERRSSPAAVA